VRKTEMTDMDIARFDFDFDTTWTAFFLDADRNIYSRYGGRDESTSDGRQTKASLLQTMREVLELHEQRKAAGRLLVKDNDVHPSPAEKLTPKDIPLLRDNHSGCVHCHQVREYRLLQAAHDGKFSRDDLFPFPLPENLGVTFDRDHGHRVKRIEPESAAASSGLRPGDTILRVNDVAVHSEGDVRWALHRAREDQPLSIVARRESDSGDAATSTTELRPPANWKQTDLGWRKSLRSVPLSLGFLGYALGREEKKTAGLADDSLAIKVASIRGSGLATNVGLKKGDLIIELASRRRVRTFEQFQSDQLRAYQPNDTVRVVVLRDGKEVAIEGPFPPWHTKETSVP
jgi:hypothetical protein